MNQPRYINEPYPKLDKNRQRVKACPCGKSNKDGKFVPYVGYEDKGYCHSCDRTFLPELLKDDLGDAAQHIITNKPKARPPKKKVSLIPVDAFKKSLQPNKDILQISETNHFVKYLVNLFGIELTNQLIAKYFIGTSKNWSGATVFWQIDMSGNIRAGKIILYNPTTGKRVKEPYQHITWVHTALKLPEFNLKQCFWGEHLLQDKTKPIAITEGEATAIIASIYLPQFIWLAVGGANGLTADKCSVLKARDVVLFPDIGKYDQWSERAKELSHLATFVVSDLLEHNAREADRKKGLDIADYLVKDDVKELKLPERLKKEEPPTQAQPIVRANQHTHNNLPNNPTNTPTHENWDNDISELERFFNNSQLPSEPIKLNPWSTIEDVSAFIESHLRYVKSNNGKKSFRPYLERLQELKQILKNSKHNS
jgi:hypothetical protein